MNPEQSTEAKIAKHLEAARRMAAENVLAGVRFWAMMTADGHLFPVGLPIDPDRDKAVDLLLLQMLAQRNNVIEAFMTSEAWVTRTDRLPGESDRQHLERSMAVLPRDSERRREAILVVRVVRDEPPIGALQWIERDPDGKAVFPEPPSVMAEGFEGIWCRVLEAPPPIPAGPAGDLIRQVLDQMVELLDVFAKGKQ